MPIKKTMIFIGKLFFSAHFVTPLNNKNHLLQSLRKCNKMIPVAQTIFGPCSGLLVPGDQISIQTGNPNPWNLPEKDCWTDARHLHHGGTKKSTYKHGQKKPLLESKSGLLLLLLRHWRTLQRKCWQTDKTSVTFFLRNYVRPKKERRGTYYYALD